MFIMITSTLVSNVRSWQMSKHRFDGYSPVSKIVLILAALVSNLGNYHIAVNWYKHSQAI